MRARSDDIDPIGPRPFAELFDFGLARCFLASLGLHVLLLGPIWLQPEPFEPWDTGSAELPPQLVRMQALLEELAPESTHEVAP